MINYKGRQTAVIGAMARVALLAIAFSSIAACVSPSATNVSVRPDQETVVLLHGLGRSARAMWLLEDRLEAAGYQVVSVDYASLRATPEEIVADVTRQIDACCDGTTGRLHFVGHSLGGLLARAYVAQRELPQLGRVVVIGSPSKGTAIVDRLRGAWWFEILGPMASALGTDSNGFPAKIGRPAYPLGVIAGRKAGDNNDLLPGDDDGLVAVDSTKVEGMADFLVVPAGHAALRYDQEVARQTIRFLREGRFEPGVDASES